MTPAAIVTPRPDASRIAGTSADLLPPDALSGGDDASASVLVCAYKDRGGAQM